MQIKRYFHSFHFDKASSDRLFNHETQAVLTIQNIPSFFHALHFFCHFFLNEMKIGASTVFSITSGRQLNFQNNYVRRFFGAMKIFIQISGACKQMLKDAALVLSLMSKQSDDSRMVF